MRLSSRPRAAGATVSSSARKLSPNWSSLPLRDRIPALTSPCTSLRQPIHCHFVLRAARTALILNYWQGMNYDPANPLIVQGDRSVLVEVDNPRYAAARDALAPFAELEKSPEHVHTYRLTDLSLWNAAAAGMTAEQMIAVLQRYTKFPLPTNLATDIAERVARYGRVKLEKHEDKLRLACTDKLLLEELARQPKLRQYLGERLDAVSFAIEPAHRGVLKQALIAVGYPAEDLAGYTAGADLPFELRPITRSGLPFTVRDYQREAADIFYAGGDVRGGSGV